MVRRILVGHALAAVGMSMVWPLLLVEVWERTHDETLLGLAGAARMLPYVALSWAAGRLADVTDRGRVVRATVVARAGALLVAAAALEGGAVGVAVAASALAVAVATPAYPALAAAIPEILRAHHRRATDLLVTIEVASFVVGPALGGLLLWAPTRPWLAWAAVVVTVIAVPVLPGRLGCRPTATPETRPVSMRAVWSWALTRIVAGMALVNLVIAVLALALVPIAEERWAGTAATYGLTTGVLGFGALAGPLLGGGQRSGSSRMRLGLAALGLAVLGVVPAPEAAWALPSLGLAGALAVVVEAAATGLLQDGVPDRVRATVLGMADTAMVAAALLGSLIGPMLVGWCGPAVVIVALSFALGAGTLLIPRSRRSAAAETVGPGVSKRLVPQ